jgi:hypothetical protein
LVKIFLKIDGKLLKKKHLIKKFSYCFGGWLSFCISLIKSLFRFSALASLLDDTAQKAAGNQPMSVICRNKQMIPWMILPLKKKDNQGNKMAMMSIICMGV